MKINQSVLLLSIIAASVVPSVKVVAQDATRVQANAPSPVVIRAGEEWTREYASGRIEVQMVTRPYFASVATALPIIEIDGVGLTFVREGDGGAMVFWGDEKLLLPRIIEIDRSGRSVRPLPIKLQVDSRAGVSRLDVDSWTFAVTTGRAAEGIMLPVIIAAGAETDWILDSFKVTAGDGTTHDWNAFTEQTAGASHNSDTSAAAFVGDSAPSLDLGPGSSGSARSNIASDVLETYKPFRPKTKEEWDHALKNAWAESIQYFKAGKYSLGEQVLAKILLNRRGTAGWHHELSVRLFNAALYLNEVGDAFVAHEVGAYALRHVELIQGHSGLQDHRRYVARAAEMAGRIHEKLYQNHQAALQSYQLSAHNGNERAEHAVARTKLYSRE